MSDELGETGRGYITPIKESVLADDVTKSGEEVERGYVWVVEPRVRGRLERRLEPDFGILVSNTSNEYDELVGIVREYSLEAGREWRGGLKPLNDEMIQQAVTARAASEGGVDADEMDAILDAVTEMLVQFDVKNGDGSE